MDEVGDLLPGMNVNGEIIIDEAENALAIPAQALQRGNVVYVQDDSVTEAQGNVPAGFRSVEVETGLISEDYVEIKMCIRDRVPGVIQCEMMAQTCCVLLVEAVKGHTPLYTGLDLSLIHI